MDYCSRPSAILFDEPIIDGTGARIGFITLSREKWQETLEELGHQMTKDAVGSYYSSMASTTLEITSHHPLEDMSP